MKALFALPPWKAEGHRFPDKDATWKVYHARERYRCEKADPRPPDCAGDIEAGDPYVRVTIYYRGGGMRELRRRRPIRLCASCGIHYGLARREPVPELEVGRTGLPNERRRKWRHA